MCSFLRSTATTLVARTSLATLFPFPGGSQLLHCSQRGRSFRCHTIDLARSCYGYVYAMRMLCDIDNGASISLYGQPALLLSFVSFKRRYTCSRLVRPQRVLHNGVVMAHYNPRCNRLVQSDLKAVMLRYPNWLTSGQGPISNGWLLRLSQSAAVTIDILRREAAVDMHA